MFSNDPLFFLLKVSKIYVMGLPTISNYRYWESAALFQVPQTPTYTHIAYIYVHIHIKIKINLFLKVVASTVNSPGNGAFWKSPALS